MLYGFLVCVICTAFSIFIVCHFSHLWSLTSAYFCWHLLQSFIIGHQCAFPATVDCNVQDSVDRSEPPDPPWCAPEACPTNVLWNSHTFAVKRSSEYFSTVQHLNWECRKHLIARQTSFTPNEESALSRLIQAWIRTLIWPGSIRILIIYPDQPFVRIHAWISCDDAIAIDNS